MSLPVKRNYVLLFGKDVYLLSGARQRKAGGNIGQLKCNEDLIKVKSLMAVWTAKYPPLAETCGGNADHHILYDPSAPGCTDGTALMIDDWTYMTKIDFP